MSTENGLNANDVKYLSRLVWLSTRDGLETKKCAAVLNIPNDSVHAAVQSVLHVVPNTCSTYVVHM